jgi:hypothetical protein
MKSQESRPEVVPIGVSHLAYANDTQWLSESHSAGAMKYAH